jgi:hypothetical protein
MSTSPAPRSAKADSAPPHEAPVDVRVVLRRWPDAPLGGMHGRSNVHVIPAKEDERLSMGAGFDRTLPLRAKQNDCILFGSWPPRREHA